MSSSDPLVTCVVTAYNHERFIARTIESILAQDYPSTSLQIVVVDDGSTDGTPDAVRPYLEEIEYVRRPNEGAWSALTPGIERARGEFLSFVDGDDMWVPDRLRRHVDFLRSHPAVGLVYGDMTLIDEHDRVLHPSFLHYAGIKPKRGWAFGALLRGNTASGGSMTVRTALRDRFCPSIPESPYGDWWVALRVAEVAPIEYLPGVVNLYRRHSNNMTLDVQGDKQARLRLDEARLQRWMLATADPSSLTIREALDAYVVFERNVLAGCQILRQPAEQAVKVSGQDERRAAALARDGVAVFQRQDPHRAVQSWIKALAANPWNTDARTLLRAFVPELTQRFCQDLSLAPRAEPAAATGAVRPENQDANAVHLDGRRGVAFLLHPDWSTADWRAVLASYVATFKADEDVTLVVFLDPAQGYAPALATRMVAQAVADLGMADADLPDLLLVPDRLEAAAVDNLYRGVDVIVGPSGPAAAERAQRAGRPCLAGLAPAAWRDAQRAAQQATTRAA